MDKLICADRLKNVLNHNFGGIGAAAVLVQLIDIAPAVDAIPVVHGHWVGTEYDGYADGSPNWETWECSECREEHYGDCDTLTAYCPHCGAKMDGENNE